TATVLAGRGVGELRLVATPTDLERLPDRAGGYLIVSELDGARASGEHIDNSPTQAQTVRLEGRLPVLVTTNGTRTLAAAAARAKRVLLASFLNLGALARYLRARQGSVTIVPAGKFERGEAHVEDDACGEALAALLAGERPDLGALERRIRAAGRV